MNGGSEDTEMSGTDLGDYTSGGYHGNDYSEYDTDGTEDILMPAIADDSHMGRLDNGLVTEILRYLDQPNLLNFAQSSKWCTAASAGIFYRRIKLSRRLIDRIGSDPQILPLIHEVDYNVSISTGYPNARFVNATIVALFIQQLPNLQIFNVHGVRSTDTVTVFYNFYWALKPLVNLRHFTIETGRECISSYFRYRRRGGVIPGWNPENMRSAVHPKLDKITVRFGAWACGIMRLDLFILDIVQPHLGTLRELDICALETKDLDYDLPGQYLHHPLRVAREGMDPHIDALPGTDTEEGKERAREGVNWMRLVTFASEKLEIFRYYSELQVPNDDDVTLEAVCVIWPNLREIDFVTRAGWKRTYEKFGLAITMQQLSKISLPGVSKVGNGANYFIELFDVNKPEFLSTADHPSTTPRDITVQMVQKFFPNVRKFCWYQRTLEDTTPRPWVGLNGQVTFRRFVFRTIVVDSYGWRVAGPVETVMWWGYNMGKYLRLAPRYTPRGNVRGLWQ
ncbi:hypothetical protein DRE_01567 [Drechslerella stenobrocha 248]|uniref:F-box domain-containing protein n=1 Tax=Drechslerella stenobrocha 248 TaxID=1043628 RepID=W7I4L5_9PEZI|nr:hypothetical protein DRE_01567 [Drechslerella stenobrocha 248]